MRIGQDISIQTCRAEGYLVMDYPARLFKKNPVDTDCTFTRSWPDYVREGMGWGVGDPIISNEFCLNYADLYALYQEHKKDIDNFTGTTRHWTDTPEPFEILNLAGDIDSYCGLK